MFSSVFGFCVELWKNIVAGTRELLLFFTTDLNDLTGLDLDLTIMNTSIIGLLLGAGLVSFLTYKLISFLIDIAP